MYIDGSIKLVQLFQSNICYHSDEFRLQRVYVFLF